MASKERMEQENDMIGIVKAWFKWWRRPNGCGSTARLAVHAVRSVHSLANNSGGHYTWDDIYNSHHTLSL
jgi:hypothetical protein